jgi:hypothetical protein
MVKAWMERAEKSANSQYARNWLQYRWSMMPPPCRAIAFQRRWTVNHAPSLTPPINKRQIVLTVQNRGVRSSFLTVFLHNVKNEDLPLLLFDP